MKLNKQIYLLGLAVTGALMLSSCGDDPKPNGGNGNGSTAGAVKIGITTSVEMKTKTNLITELDNGRAMNVWAKKFDTIDGEDFASGIKATSNGGSWTLSPEVGLEKNGDVAFVYATYPYSEANTDPKAVALDITKQEDYLYSGTAMPASFQNPTANLNMKHAQAILSVNIKKEGYSGNGVITKLSVTGGNLIATAGTLHVGTGKITPTQHGSLSASVDNKAIGENGISGALPGVWVVPFVSKDQADEVMATITIDGKEYTAALPEVTMRAGWQYIFHAVISKNGLVFLADDIEEYQLDKADDEIAPLQGHGVIVFDFAGGTFTFPNFFGDNIFGTILTANGTGATYNIGGSMEVSGAQTISVETWNSTGFEVANFEGINGIDLSGY